MYILQLLFICQIVVQIKLAIFFNVSVLLYYERTQLPTVENFDQPNKMANVQGTTTYILHSYY